MTAILIFNSVFLYHTLIIMCHMTLMTIGIGTHENFIVQLHCFPLSNIYTSTVDYDHMSLRDLVKIFLHLTACTLCMICVRNYMCTYAFHVVPVSVLLP